jgi:hypothetical protein
LSLPPTLPCLINFWLIIILITLINRPRDIFLFCKVLLFIFSTILIFAHISSFKQAFYFLKFSTSICLRKNHFESIFISKNILSLRINSIHNKFLYNNLNRLFWSLFFERLFFGKLYFKKLLFVDWLLSFNFLFGRMFRYISLFGWVMLFLHKS